MLKEAMNAYAVFGFIQELYTELVAFQSLVIDTMKLMLQAYDMILQLFSESLVLLKSRGFSEINRFMIINAAKLLASRSTGDWKPSYALRNERPEYI